jgi:hypothetical protein
MRAEGKNNRRSFDFAQDDSLFVLLNLSAWINMRREPQPDNPSAA